MATYYLWLTFLAICVAGSFVTYWFLTGMLNPFIEAVVGIVITGVLTVASFFLTPFMRFGQLLMRGFGRIPLSMKAILYFCIGCGVFIFDHYYNTTIFAKEEMTFYLLNIMGTAYRVTEIACWIGGFFLFLCARIVLKGFGALFHYTFDRTIRISVLIYR